VQKTQDPGDVMAQVMAWMTMSVNVFVMRNENLLGVLTLNPKP